MDISGNPSFARPKSPAARVLHLLRPGMPLNRTDIAAATGLSQPTVTRAIQSLNQAGIIDFRPDLVINSKQRGRRPVPVEIAPHSGFFAGIAVGTTSHYVALYNLQGRTLRHLNVRRSVAGISPDEFIQTLVKAVEEMAASLTGRLLGVGMTTSGRVRRNGIVDAANLGWHGVHVAPRLEYYFRVPITVSSAVSAILGAELQTTHLQTMESTTTLAIFADDSISAALSGIDGTVQIPHLPLVNSRILTATATPPELCLNTEGFLELAARDGALPGQPNFRVYLDERARLLGVMAAELLHIHTPNKVVIAGSAFTDDATHAPKIFARTVRKNYSSDPAPQLRMIPTHREIVASIARAVALDAVFRDPLSYPNTTS
ncbi:ROK family transcriptional regulator [Corynebacterium caspium]|uniref:ROK family transcriptional regulator n=1 Tax=Corynebacterium caspium TaxID=234828 RepID=UPI0003751821|nr:ROK family transcriptional regulator [Corynebacterium caspium]WKD58498.1 MarR family protein [Corynebacterium caspium DSM 44850]